MKYHISTEDEITEKMIEAFLLKHYSKEKFSVNIVSSESELREKTNNIVICSSLPERKNPGAVYLSRPLSLAKLGEILDRIGKKKLSDVPHIYNGKDRVLFSGDLQIRFSRKEAMLFEMLYDAGGELVSEKAIKDAIWSDCEKSNIVAVYINYLRRKLSPVFGPGAVVSKSGVGYALKL